MKDQSLNDLLGSIFSPPTGLYGGEQETPNITLRDILTRRNPKQQPTQSLAELYAPEEASMTMPEEEGEESKWGKLLKQLFSPLAGFGSIPDVVHDTDFSDPAEVIGGMPLRYLRNIGTGILGGFGIGSPDYNTAEDVLDKYGLMQDSKAKPWVGMGLDIAADPFTFLGGGLAKQGVKKVGGKALGSMYK